MRVALYQILYLDKIPIPAAINESVEIVKRVQGEKTAGIVNGVLRNIARNIDNIRYPDKQEDIIYFYSIIHSHPRWMVRRWLERFGETGTEKLLLSNNERPNISIRVNLLKATIEEVCNYFELEKLIYIKSPFTKQSITLKTPRLNISSLTLFQNGSITNEF